MNYNELSEKTLNINNSKLLYFILIIKGVLQRKNKLIIARFVYVRRRLLCQKKRKLLLNQQN